MRTSLGARRSVVALLTVVAIGLPTMALPSPAHAATADAGLFGSSDPTFDGTFRQSMAILGLTAAKAPVPASAAAWLSSQQCPDGSYQAYRSDSGRPCDRPDPEAFTGPDSNSTALAASALRSAGRTASANRAVAALIRTQNADGGWGYTLGGSSDVNSTGLALIALRGAPTTRAATKSVTRAMRYLRSAQVPCASPAAIRFALPYQPGQPANALASTQALIGIAGTLPVPIIARTGVRGTGCEDRLIRQVSSYVNRLLRTNRGAVPSAVGDGTDWNATAFGVLGLAAAGAAPSGIAVGIAALGRNATAYVGTGASASPRPPAP